MNLPAAPFVLALEIRPRDGNQAPDYTEEIPSLRELGRVELHPRVTFLVGENGSGKSTLVEAMAVASKLNPEGGGKLLRFTTRKAHSDLHRRLTLERSELGPMNAFFLRAESVFNLATAIETGGRSARARMCTTGRSTSSRTASRSSTSPSTASARVACTSSTSRRRRSPSAGSSR
jgi:predicted ATPase